MSPVIDPAIRIPERPTDEGEPMADAPSGEEVPAYRRRFTVADVRRLDQLGFFRPEERVELIDGDLVVMSRIGSFHAGCTKGLARRFILALGDRATVGVQDPIRLSDQFEPEPDISVARYREDNYASAHPGAADLFLVVEIMDTSGPYDRGVKLPRYAREGVPETWLVDLWGGFIERHRRPIDGSYSERFLLHRGQTISPEAFPDLVLTVDSILSRPES